MTPEEKQLERILASDVFAGGGKFRKNEELAKLLRHIVMETLAGRTPTDTTLLLDFFKLPVDAVKEKNPIARVAVGRLREKLPVYYATFGIDDPYFLEIPSGQYGARFKSNRLSPAQKDTRLGFFHVDHESPSEIEKALKYFDSAIARDGKLADAFAGKSSALMTRMLHSVNEPPLPLLEAAELAAQTAKEIDKNCWIAHANLGAARLWRHDWVAADAAFKQAEELSPLEIDKIGGYGLFLLSRGRYDEALALANAYIDEGFRDFVRLTRAALYLYALRDYPRTEAVLLMSLERNKFFWRTHLGFAFLYLSTGDPERALSHMSEVRTLSEMDLWPGMAIACLEAAGKLHEAEQRLQELLALSQIRYIQPMQLGLGCMALGRNEEAIGYLRRACDECDPFTAWLHLWPFLDPLRRYPQFRALLQKWDFPKA